MEYFEYLKINVGPRIHRCERSWSWSVHEMHDYDLWCVLNGVGEIQHNGALYPIRPGTCWLLEPGDRCEAKHDPENRLRVLAVHFDVLTADGKVRRLAEHERPSAGTCVQDHGLLEALCRGFVGAQRQGGALGERQGILYLRQLLFTLLAEMEEGAAEVIDPRVRRAQDAIMEDPGKDWSVTALARKAGLSRSQFSRLFTEAIGRPPVRFVLEARIERARQLLKETTLQVGEIADALGYRDIFYFSRQFKELVGMTPTAYRSQPPIPR